MPMEILGNLISPTVEIAKFTFAPVGRQIGYLVHYNKNVDVLKNEVAKLGRRRAGIKRRADEALRRGETIDSAVEEWFKKVDDIESDVKKLDETVEGNNYSFFNGKRRKLSKEAVEKFGVVCQLQREGNFSSISRLGPPPSIDQTPVPYFKAFGSTRSAKKRIMAALDSDELNIIGVYGMGGVGKTMLMREVAVQAKREQTFDEVIMVTVSQHLDLKKLQKHVAEKLGLRLKGEFYDTRALRLAARLKQEKKILIIIDDVWEKLELDKVGIPYGSDHKGCKIAITTRSLDVCKDMDCESSINVEVINQEDSWELFKKFVGEVININSLQTIAKMVAQECGGLPLALVILGRAMRNKKEPSKWLTALRALRQSKFSDINGMYKYVFSSIKLSIDFIRSESIKLCFLYCCLFPEDYGINVELLVASLLGEGLFEDLETIDDGRTRVHAIIDNLKASCLLLESEREGHVKMHDVIRDVAILIASSDAYGFLAKTGTNQGNWPKQEYLRNLKRISLSENVKEFPYQIEYPNLKTLVVVPSFSLLDVPDDFFIQMKALKVLHLSSTMGTTSLPMSLRSLTNLTTLFIESMILEDASILAQLTTLEILGLRNSVLHVFPKDIRRLTKLRFLDLRLHRPSKDDDDDTDHPSNDLTIPPHVISSLTRLEEVYFGNSFTGWEVEELPSRRFANLAEVCSLRSLTILHIHVRDHNCLFKNFVNYPQNLRNFSIEIGFKDDYSFLLDPNTSGLRVNRKNEIGAPRTIGKWAKALLEKTQILWLEYWKDLENIEEVGADDFIWLASLKILGCSVKTICSSSFLKRFICLCSLEVFHCLELEVVFDSDDLYSETSVLPCLETIALRNLPKLISIWRGIDPSVFEGLQHLEVEHCPGLGELFTPAFAETLGLISLKIICCSSMTTIISNENDDNLFTRSQSSATDKILFPKLKILILSGLGITSFIQPEILLDFPSLEEMSVKSCHYLKRLPFGPQSLPKLRKFKADEMWFEELEFENASVKVRLEGCLEFEDEELEVKDDSVELSDLAFEDDESESEDEDFGI